MINLSNYSCDKCARSGSRHCKHCLHTADKAPTKFKRKNNMFQKLIKEAQDIDDAINSFKTPEFRKSAPPPPPTTGSNAVKPKKLCAYKTPCGWCSKWDKECDLKPYKRGLRVKINPIDNAIDVPEEVALTNKTCESEDDHKWVCYTVSTGGCHYICEKCGEHKYVLYTSSTSNGYQGG